MTNRRTFLFLSIGFGILGGCGGGQGIVPLEEGVRWEYEVSLRGRFNTTGAEINTAMPERSLGRHTVVPLRRELVGANTTFIDFVLDDETGLYSIGRQRPDSPEPQTYDTPRYFLKRPLEVGHTWTTDAELQIFEDGTPVELTREILSMDDTVTVPAGTFENCIQISISGNVAVSMGAAAMGTTANIRIEGNEWFAPGVGLVRALYRETSDHLLHRLHGPGEFSAQLRSISR